MQSSAQEPLGEREIYDAQIGLVNQLPAHASGKPVLIDFHTSLLGHRKLHRDWLTTNADARDRKSFGRGIIQTNACEIDRETVFQCSDNHLKNAAQIQPFRNRTSDLVQQIQTLQLGMKPLLSVLVLFDF